ncbi:sensor domain-containing diguanylate cyclase [Aquabacterium sp.]|uniref:sensor domain-containing diguanylate cyclase n=1 Tax=Aquabacterium sp. TaxID=1872578 RepID=UPI002BB69140|nr:GGDEF domain-containing protein [Aquabacterium sp.]HSW06850.1 GGDEF domain-containing protein [Aquabacterium sp.]
MLGNVALTLLTLLLLLLAASAGWAMAGRALNLSQRAARHWTWSALFCAFSLALILARGTAPDWLAMSGGNVLSVLSVLAMRRGALLFLRQPMADSEAVLILVLVTVSNLLALLLPAAHVHLAQVMLTCGALAWTLMRMSVQTYPTLRGEFGERTAFLLVAPLVAGVAMFTLRMTVGFIPQAPTLQPLPMDTPLNVASALLILLLTLLQHASMVVMALQRMVRKLRHLSQRDALTGLYNRAEWTRQLEAQHRWLGRFGEPFGVLMIDIDHFKKINDTLGHAAGDAVLLTVAQVLTASAREVDVIGRLGGEEFGVLLPRSEHMTVRRAAERLRQALGDAETSWKDQPIRLTVSIGAALGTDADEAPSHVLERADRALYQAKNNGRNRTVVARIAS